MEEKDSVVHKTRLSEYIEQTLKRLGYTKSSTGNSFVKGFVKVEIDNGKVFVFHDIKGSLKSEVINLFTELLPKLIYMESRGMGD